MVGVPPLGPKDDADWRASHACLAASSAVCIWSRPPRGGRGSASSGPQEWAGPAGRSPTSPSSKPTGTIFSKVLGILAPLELTALLLRRKYVLSRCALVCERLRCEPWRPWGWGGLPAGLEGPRAGGWDIETGHE